MKKQQLTQDKQTALNFMPLSKFMRWSSFRFAIFGSSMPREPSSPPFYCFSRQLEVANGLHARVTCLATADMWSSPFFV